MPISVTPELFATLRRTANLAMWREWRTAHPPGAPVYEVFCIKNLVERALPEVQRAWAQVLADHGTSATLTGVVCHGRPVVTFQGAVRACELGDLLLVHDHLPDQGRLERRATVIQAKVFGPHGVTSRNDIQLSLYRRWPLFTYTGWPGGLGALSAMLASHQLTGPTSFDRHIALTATGQAAATTEIDAGCRYGMIDTANNPWGDPYRAMNPWRLCSPNVPDLYRHNWGLSLGGYLVRLMMGAVGRRVPFPGWPANLSAACHWSLMVEELLALLPPAPVSGMAVSLLANSTTVGTGSAPPQSGHPKAGDEEGAFTVILLSTQGGPAA